MKLYLVLAYVVVEEGGSNIGPKLWKGGDCTDVERFLLFSTESICSMWILFVGNDYRSSGFLRNFPLLVWKEAELQTAHKIFPLNSEQRHKPYLRRHGKVMCKGRETIGTQLIWHMFAGTHKQSQGSRLWPASCEVYERNVVPVYSGGQ